MRIRNTLITFLLSALTALHLSGCSSDDSPDTPPVVTPEDPVGNEIVIYEANPGLFGTSGALNAITARLDDIKALGANVVWLMPTYQQGSLNAFGSPYCVRDYKSVNSRYGTLDDLKTLVTAAHSKNMRVILDWVGNHTSWDHAWIENKSWYTQDAGGNIVSPPGMGWSDVADLNYSNAEMRAAMLDAMLYWVREAKVDGYRCDYADGVPNDFWTTAITSLKALKGDDLLMLAESGEASFFSLGFDLVYGWDFAYRLQNVYAGSSTVTSLYALHAQEYQNVPEGKQRMRYTTNHDMASGQSPIQVFGGEQGALSAYVIATTLGGTPMIYSSQETGYAQALSFFNQQAFNWNANTAYTAQYKKIMEIYNASDALRKGELKTYDTGTTAGFYRQSTNEGVLILVNTTNSAQTVKIPIEHAYEEAINLMDNTTTTLPATLAMDPYQFYIWKMK